ncbi:unnamed protein product, partial [marine sediment metagenome]
SGARKAPQPLFIFTPLSFRIARQRKSGTHNPDSWL